MRYLQHSVGGEVEMEHVEHFVHTLGDELEHEEWEEMIRHLRSPCKSSTGWCVAIGCWASSGGVRGMRRSRAPACPKGSGSRHTYKGVAEIIRRYFG